MNGENYAENRTLVEFILDSSQSKRVIDYRLVLDAFTNIPQGEGVGHYDTGVFALSVLSSCYYYYVRNICYGN
ncbi:hypothetical protein AALO_G00036210 [Alosa alosa]|uniref:Uncharacterized protein n=1 Tax=Alosa alosa TaxID=278164 RepID=A0AAV6H6D7_9TELE|nr:hypothetical protein AALO_G00036210 [Alosa alosa]